MMLKAENGTEQVKASGTIAGIQQFQGARTLQMNGAGTDGIILHIDDQTKLNRFDGSPLAFDELKIGLAIEAEHRLAMTLSLPPQTYAFEVRLTSPDELKGTDSYFMMGTGGTVHELMKDEGGGVASIRVQGAGLTAQSPSDVILRIEPDTVVEWVEGGKAKADKLQRNGRVLVFYNAALTRSMPPIGKAWKIVIQ